MANTHMFTTAISEDLLKWLRQFSKEHHTTQQSVLEEALKKYRFEARRNEFLQGFKRASKETELMDLAEMGLDDYEEQLKHFEK